MDQEKKQGLIAILSANTIFGLNIPITKALMDDWMSPIGYTVTRMFFGAAIFWLIGMAVKDRKLDKKDYLPILAGGLMGFIGTQFLFSQALLYTSPVIFSLLMALTPVMVLLLSALILNESLPKRKLLGVLVSISGASLIILLSQNQSGKGSNNLLGIGFALLCVLCYAGYLVLTRKVSTSYQPVTIAKWMFLVSAIAAAPFSFGSLPEQVIYSGSANVQAYLFLGFALLFSTTLAFFLMPYSLKRLEASTVSIFMNLQPIVASVVAIFVGQDTFTWDKPLAVGLVVFGVYLVTSSQNNPNPKTSTV